MPARAIVAQLLEFHQGKNALDHSSLHRTPHTNEGAEKEQRRVGWWSIEFSHSSLHRTRHSTPHEGAERERERERKKKRKKEKERDRIILSSPAFSPKLSTFRLLSPPDGQCSELGLSKYPSLSLHSLILALLFFYPHSLGFAEIAPQYLCVV